LVSACQKYFFQCFTFYLYVSLVESRVTCRQLIVVYYFLVQSDNLCLLIGELSPFTFRMMVERYLLIPVFPFLFIHTEAPIDCSFFKCKVEEFIEIEE
jgi:hypothetical protein